MKVKELIEKLQEVNPELKLYTYQYNDYECRDEIKKDLIINVYEQNLFQLIRKSNVYKRNSHLYW